MTQGYETLDSLIRDECLIQDDLNLSNYLKYLAFAKEALRDWTLDKRNEVNVVVDVTTNIATLPFPDDYLKWSKIGTVVGDRIKTLIVNNKLALVHSLDSNGDPINNPPYTPNYTGSTSSIISGTVIGNGYYYYDVSNTGIYGFGNGGYLNDGQFRVDLANRRFQFSSDWTNKTIYLEYVSTGLNPTAATVVDGNASKTIKRYIRWQAIETSRTSSMAEKMRAEEQYWNENLTASKRTLDVSIDKILGIAREGYKTSPKY